MQTLLENLEAKRINFVHLKRKAPTIVLTRKGKDATRQVCQLLDVGTDFIEIGHDTIGIKNTLIVPRDQIAEVLFTGEAE